MWSARNVVISLVVLLGNTALVAASGNSDGRGSLRVQVQGLAHAGGQAAAYLFRSQDKLPGKNPFRKAYGPIHNGQGKMVFQDLSFGDYAIIVFHDENGNGEPDHSLFLVPLEPVGFSNQFRPGLRNGLPSFEKLRFSFSAAETQQIVVLP